jgi:CRP-like cAMP-binding protein
MESAGPSQVELVVLRWFADWLGLPDSTAGILVSGGSAANMTALAAARERVPLFAYLARDTVRELAVSAKTVRYDAATVVFRENDSAVDAYFIVDGQVEFDQAGGRIRTLGPGMLFGEGAVLRPGTTRAATATAAPGTVLLRLPGEQVRVAVTQS